MMTIFENDFASANFVKEEYVYMVYKRFVPSEKFRELWTQVYDFAKDKTILKWLTDGREMGVVSDADQEWLLKLFASDTNATQDVKGMHTYSAIILSDNIFAKLSAESLMDKNQIRHENTNNTSEIKYFANEEEAVKWIEQV